MWTYISYAAIVLSAWAVLSIALGALIGRRIRRSGEAQEAAWRAEMLAQRVRDDVSSRAQQPVSIVTPRHKYQARPRVWGGDDRVA